MLTHSAPQWHHRDNEWLFYCDKPSAERCSVVRFKNVGDGDFNEGALNYVAIALCRGFR